MKTRFERNSMMDLCLIKCLIPILNLDYSHDTGNAEEFSNQIVCHRERFVADGDLKV